MIIIPTVLTGLKYPIAASLGFAVWVGARVLYTRGYVTGDPEKRNPGGELGYFTCLGMIASATWSVISMVWEAR